MLLKELKVMEQETEGLKVMEQEKIKMFVDNKSTIDLVNHPMNHDKNKNIERMCHFLKDQVNKRKLKLEYYISEVLLADTLTKLLKNTRFHELKELIEMKSLENMN